MRELARRVLPLRVRRYLRDQAIAARARVTLWRQRRVVRVISRNGAPTPTVYGQSASDAQPVIMCLWRRPERLAAILEELAGQDLDQRIELLLWNNEPGNDALYRNLLAEGVDGALARVELYSSPVNVGGAGRMLAADTLRRRGYRGPVVLLDDDQRVGPAFLRNLRDSWSERTYAGVWAWRIHGDYWDRSPAAPGQPATYVGTGGSVVDVELLTDSGLRRALDSADLMLEDILLSWRANQLGFRVVGAGAPFEFVEDEHDQWHALADRKPALYARLGEFARHPRPDSV